MLRVRKMVYKVDHEDAVIAIMKALGLHKVTFYSKKCGSSLATASFLGTDKTVMKICERLDKYQIPVMGVHF